MSFKKNQTMSLNFKSTFEMYRSRTKEYHGFVLLPFVDTAVQGTGPSDNSISLVRISSGG